MLKHNLKLFLRNVGNNTGTFFINTIGLGIGIAAFLVLALYVYNDLTYNHFNENLANIYRVQERYPDGNGDSTKGLVLPTLLGEVPEIENGTRIFDWDGYRLSHGDVAFEENVLYVDSGFFSVFTFPFTEGSSKNVLDEKFDAVISTSFAKKYFGTDQALGKQFQVGFEDIFLTVKGVVSIPENSSVKFDIVTSYETGQTISPWVKDVHDWYNTFSITYVVLRPGTTAGDIQDKLQRLVKENFLPTGGNDTELYLLPFADYHATMESDQKMILILTFIAFGILGIAIVNFINLTITNTWSRTKEMGIKKVHGASKGHLVLQIVTESLLVGLVAVLFGILLTTFLLVPSFNSLFETNLKLKTFDRSILIPVLLGIWLLVGLVSGLVPAFIWARAKLIESLKGKVLSGTKRSSSKYSSIVVQFVIAMVLISGTMLIRKQTKYMMEKDPKFDNENVLVAQTDYWQFKDLDKTSQQLARISKELEASPLVASVGFTGSIPGDYDENYNMFYPETESNLEVIALRKSYVGDHYFKTMGIPIISGQGFDSERASLENTVVLNRTAMNRLGFENAEGQILREGRETGTRYKLIGVIEDFNYQGAQHEMQPLAHFYYKPENYAEWDYLTIRAEKGASLQVLELLKTKWKEALPEGVLTHFFADEKLNVYYQEFQKVNTIITWFSILAILLSCIGLFALATHAMARRRKEIGIRKVNGAKVSEILTMLNKDFLKWVALAFVIAVPVSWYAMEKWLESFAYKTEISWWLFGFSGLTAMLIAFLTVSWRSFRAAVTNPVEALREE